MSFSLYIARRYLFSRKKVNAINIISAISVTGVALSTAAMLCTLSVFNGFEEMVGALFTSLDPELKIQSASKKTFDSASVLESLSSMDFIDATSVEVEENVMVRYGERQQMATLLGVDGDFRKTVDVDSILLGEGTFRLREQDSYYVIPGIGLASNLRIGLQFIYPLEVYAPRKDAQINIANPSTAFRKTSLLSSGLAFMVNQDKYDDSHILCDLSYAREALGLGKDEATAIGLRLKKGQPVSASKRRIQKVLSGKGDYRILDRYEQQEDVYKIMELEKMISYLFLTFILLISSFNIIGSLTMLILDKKEDIQILKAMGASRSLISKIFLLEGWLISLLGALLGIAIGLLLIACQQKWGLISLGSDFIIEDYPVSVHFLDILIILGTVAVSGLLSALYPVRTALRKQI